MLEAPVGLRGGTGYIWEIPPFWKPPTKWEVWMEFRWRRFRISFLGDFSVFFSREFFQPWCYLKRRVFVIWMMICTPTHTHLYMYMLYVYTKAWYHKHTSIFQCIYCVGTPRPVFYHSLGIQDISFSYIFLICGCHQNHHQLPQLVDTQLTHLHPPAGIFFLFPEDLPGTREQLLVSWSHVTFFCLGGDFFGCAKKKRCFENLRGKNFCGSIFSFRFCSDGLGDR